MTKRRPVRNLLGLAVLAALYQRPMHPYEIAKSLKETGKEHDMGLKWGSFYSVIANLEKYHLIANVGSSREGNRPERTTYCITEDGRAELVDWVRELVSRPRIEESGFRAGLSVLPVLHPDEAITLLRQRVDRLRSQLDTDRASLAGFASQVPRLFLIETEYDLALLEVEINWTAALADEFATGTFPGLAGWRTVHETGIFPPELMPAHDPPDQRDK